MTSIGVGASQGNRPSPLPTNFDELFAQLPPLEPWSTSTPRRASPPPPTGIGSLTTPQSSSSIPAMPSPPPPPSPLSPLPAVGVGNRPFVGMKQPRQRPWPPSQASSSSGTPSSSSRRTSHLTQEDLRRQFDLLAEDQRQRTTGRNIAAVTHTNTITTVYKDGRAPSVHRTSSRLSTPTP